MVPAVAKPGLGNFLSLAFDIAAGQVLEQHFVLGGEEVLPSSLQMGK